MTENPELNSKSSMPESLDLVQKMFNQEKTPKESAKHRKEATFLKAGKRALLTQNANTTKKVTKSAMLALIFLNT
jgi:hypothetical protein